MVFTRPRQMRKALKSWETSVGPGVEEDDGYLTRWMETTMDKRKTVTGDKWHLRRINIGSMNLVLI